MERKQKEAGEQGRRKSRDKNKGRNGRKVKVWEAEGQGGASRRTEKGIWKRGWKGKEASRKVDREGRAIHNAHGVNIKDGKERKERGRVSTKVVFG